jgi:hypothetical protein
MGITGNLYSALALLALLTNNTNDSKRDHFSELNNALILLKIIFI